jgi:hypothetical protein
LAQVRQQPVPTGGGFFHYLTQRPKNPGTYSERGIFGPLGNTPFTPAHPRSFAKVFERGRKAGGDVLLTYIEQILVGALIRISPLEHNQV